MPGTAMAHVLWCLFWLALLPARGLLAVPREGFRHENPSACHCCQKMGPIRRSAHCHSCSAWVCPEKSCREKAKVLDDLPLWSCCHCMGIPLVCRCPQSEKDMSQLLLKTELRRNLPAELRSSRELPKTADLNRKRRRCQTWWQGTSIEPLPCADPAAHLRFLGDAGMLRKMQPLEKEAPTHPAQRCPGQAARVYKRGDIVTASVLPHMIDSTRDKNKGFIEDRMSRRPPADPPPQELRRDIQERCYAAEQRLRDFCRGHMSPEQQATGHAEQAAKGDAAKAKAPDDVSQRHSPSPNEAATRAALPASAKSAEAVFCGSPGTPIGVQDPAALRSTIPRSGRSPSSFHIPSPCHINMSAVSARDVQDVSPSATTASPSVRPQPELPAFQQVQQDFPGTATRPAGAQAVEAEGSVPYGEDSGVLSQGIMSLPLEDLGLQSEDLASQRERGSGFNVNDDPSSVSVYATIPLLPLKRSSAPQAAPVNRKKKDEKEESARSSRRSSVSGFVAASIEEVGMEPLARDSSCGRALRAKTDPPTATQDSAEEAQHDSGPGTEPVTREKNDEGEGSARSSGRSGVSSSAAESIEEIGMEPGARGRALSVEMAPPTAKESSAEAAKAGPLPGEEPETREKKDEKESARSSRRSSVFEAFSHLDDLAEERNRLSTELEDFQAGAHVTQIAQTEEHWETHSRDEKATKLQEQVLSQEDSGKELEEDLMLARAQLGALEAREAELAQ
ncbi:unnamed protein product, partial [Symbiodinium sp. CCMP2592]